MHAMTLRTHVAAAAPDWVRIRLDGPRRDAVVVHAGLHAIYVAVSDGQAPRCLGLLSRSSSVVPCGLRTTLVDLSAVGGEAGMPVAGDLASIGGGQLHLGAVEISVGRIVDLSTPRLDRAAAATLAGRLREVLADRLAPVKAELTEESLTLLAQADAAAVPLLLGRGSGLTPVGDDVIAGWLAIMKATQTDPGAVASTVARLAPKATTLLSATLLDRAAGGDVLPEFRQLLLALRVSGGRPPAGELGNAVERMLAIGHTSGSGLMLGSLLAFDHLSHLSTHSPSARSPQS